MVLRTATPPRLAAVVAAGLLLSGCGTDPVATQSCRDDLCTITLVGSGSSVEVKAGGGGTLELVGIEETTARFKVNGSEGDVTQGVPIGFGRNATLTLTKIADDTVTVNVDGTTAPEDAAIGN